MGNEILEEAARLQDELVEWRRTLHQIPELGTHLPQTVAFITGKLDEMGISYKVYDEISCVEAVIGAGKKCFLLRSDVDGLPVREEADVAFRSTNGNMHGCGHDMHGTILLGAAKLLKMHEQELKGTVKLLFQSGEEVFQGAKAAIKAGVLDNPHVDAAFAMHVIGSVPMGMLLTGKYAMSAVYGFKVELKGHGGHGSMPEACVDPINAAVQVYLALQSLIAREVGGTQEAVLTIGHLAAGEVANVIPERAVLEGTLRTFTKEVRDRLIARIGAMSKAVAAAYRCECEIEVLSDCPSVCCDDELTAEIEESLQSIMPKAQIMKEMHGMGSEDFAEFTQQIPSAYWMIGAGVPEQSKWVGQHNPKILFNEDVLQVGAACYAKAAMDWLKRHGE